MKLSGGRADRFRHGIPGCCPAAPSVRRYDLTRRVPPEVIERIVRNGPRASSAGFSQGWGFLVLDSPGDVARFRDAARPESDPEDCR
jgi:nitroreductase